MTDNLHLSKKDVDKIKYIGRTSDFQLNINQVMERYKNYTLTESLIWHISIDIQHEIDLKIISLMQENS